MVPNQEDLTARNKDVTTTQSLGNLGIHFGDFSVNLPDRTFQQKL